MEYINLEYEETNNGCTEKLIMVTVSLQEYRSLVEENAMQRTIIDKMTYDIEKAKAEADEWQKRYWGTFKKRMKKGRGNI